MTAVLDPGRCDGQANYRVPYRCVCGHWDGYHDLTAKRRCTAHTPDACPCTELAAPKETG